MTQVAGEVDGSTSAYQYRLILLDMAREDEAFAVRKVKDRVGGLLAADAVVSRAVRYWEFVLGVDTAFALDERDQTVEFRPDEELSEALS